MHYYKFNISDWHLATSHLSLEEEAVYFKLINYYYDTEQPIPQETESVIRRLRLTNHEETVASILGEFFVLQKNGYNHLRCNDEIKKYKNRKVINKVVGKLGGRPPKTKDMGAVEEVNPQITQSVINENPQITLTSNQKPVTTNHYSDDFELFFKTYGKSVGKAKAFGEWKKIKPNKELVDLMIAKAKAQAIAQPDKQFRKDPERWIKDRRWEDDLSAQIAKHDDIFAPKGI